MTKELSLRARKDAEKKDMTERVQAALKEALAEARKAFDDFAPKAPRDKSGDFNLSRGGALIKVWAPTYRFRVAMLAAGALSKGCYSGEWYVKTFVSDVFSIDYIDVQEVIAWAVLNVLERRFPDERFTVSSYKD